MKLGVSTSKVLYLSNPMPPYMLKNNVKTTHRLKP